MLHKMSKQNISTMDLQSERTLKNQRESRKNLNNAISSGSFMNQEEIKGIICHDSSRQVLATGQATQSKGSLNKMLTHEQKERMHEVEEKNDTS